MIPMGYIDYSLDQSTSKPETGSRTGLILVSILIIGLAVFMVAKLVSPPANVKAANLELEKVQAAVHLEHDRRQALKQQIQAKLNLTQAKLDALEQECHAIGTEFLSQWQVPLDQAHLTMSRKMSHAALQSPAFLESLTLLLNSRFGPASFAEPSNTIGRIAGNLAFDSIGDSYITALDDVLIWIEHKQQTLQQQRRILDRLHQSSL
jgi:hypothetical protein